MTTAKDKARAEVKAAVKAEVKAEARMTKIEGALKHIQDDLNDIKHSFKAVEERIDELDKTKYRLQGGIWVMGSGLFVLFVEVFLLG